RKLRLKFRVTTLTETLSQTMLQALLLLLVATCTVAQSTTEIGPAVDIDCLVGFEAVNGVCTDVDECQRLNDDGSGVLEEDRRDICGNYVHSHRPGYRCVNTPGSYRCERIVDCGFGYRLNETLGVCIDIDECAVLGYEAACGLKLPIKVCINLEGSFRCDYRTCPPGRYLDRTTGECNPCRRGYAKNLLDECVDIDECGSRKDSCPPHMRCVNYIGGYECKHKIFCPMGRRANYNGTLCIDIDECAEHPKICGVGRNCINLDGSYRCESKQCGRLQELNSQSGECVCTEGFRMNATSKLCEDINECTEGRHNCDANDVCRNTRGHYDCLSRDKVCEPGFGLSFDHSSCVDIDECRLGHHKCSEREVCNNTHGSYVCECSPGFHRVGGSRECTDIDECTLKNGSSPCPAHLQCRNSPGSYTCVCPLGYQPNNASDIANASLTCVDIDECAQLPDICGSVGTCRNSPAGAYTCTCPGGYMATDVVRGTCADIDECQLNACPAGAACRNTPGNYDCQCRPGFLFVRQKNLCEDINECDQPDNECAQNGTSCFNYRGGSTCYRHACPEGFRLPRSGSGLHTANTLSFSCRLIGEACHPAPRFDGVRQQRRVCIKRHRIVHKAQEMLLANRGSFVTVQSDMRLGLRECQFRATLFRASGLRTTSYQVETTAAPTDEEAVRFHQRQTQRYTICSTELRIDGAASADGNSTGGTDPVQWAQVEVVLIKGAAADISNNTVNLIYL
ncbi:hypothetical protein BOX15_Mlig007225g2, partial [Macrostomum lignano]